MFMLASGEGERRKECGDGHHYLIQCGQVQGFGRMSERHPPPPATELLLSLKTENASVLSHATPPSITETPPVLWGTLFISTVHT